MSGASRTSPSRTSRACGDVSTASESSVRLARSSWKIPIAGVRDQHEPEQRVLDRADDQDHDQHRAEQRVEPREDVRADDLADRARRGGRHVVDLAARDALGDLLRGQALGGGHGRRYRSPGLSRSARPPRVEQAEGLVLVDRAAFEPELHQVRRAPRRPRARVRSRGAPSPACRPAAAASRRGSPPRRGARSAPRARPGAPRASCALNRFCVVQSARVSWLSWSSSGPASRTYRRTALSLHLAVAVEAQVQLDERAHVVDDCVGYRSAWSRSRAMPRADHLVMVEGDTVGRDLRGSSACRCRAAAPRAGASGPRSPRVCSTTAYVWCSTSLCLCTGSCSSCSAAQLRQELLGEAGLDQQLEPARGRLGQEQLRELVVDPLGGHDLAGARASARSPRTTRGAGDELELRRRTAPRGACAAGRRRTRPPDRAACRGVWPRDPSRRRTDRRTRRRAAGRPSRSR